MSKGQIWVKFDQRSFKFGKNCAKYGMWDFEHSELSGSSLEVNVSP
jgi:hypothetical protein